MGFGSSRLTDIGERWKTSAASRVRIELSSGYGTIRVSSCNLPGFCKPQFPLLQKRGAITCHTVGCPPSQGHPETVLLPPPNTAGRHSFQALSFSAPSIRTLSKNKSTCCHITPKSRTHPLNSRVQLLNACHILASCGMQQVPRCLGDHFSMTLYSLELGATYPRPECLLCLLHLSSQVFLLCRWPSQ